MHCLRECNCTDDHRSQKLCSSLSLTLFHVPCLRGTANLMSERTRTSGVPCEHAGHVSVWQTPMRRGWQAPSLTPWMLPWSVGAPYSGTVPWRTQLNTPCSGTWSEHGTWLWIRRQGIHVSTYVDIFHLCLVPIPAHDSHSTIPILATSAACGGLGSPARPAVDTNAACTRRA